MKLIKRVTCIIACLPLVAVIWLGLTVLSTYVTAGLTKSAATLFGYSQGVWFDLWFYTWEIVYLLLILASPFLWRRRAMFNPLVQRCRRWAKGIKALGLALQAQSILLWRSIMDNAIARRVFYLSSYVTVMLCYMAAGILSSLGLVAIASMLMWPPICLGGYIADHTHFVASMADIDPFLWKCMFYLIALSPVTIPLRIVVRVWWRLIGNRMFEQTIFTNGDHDDVASLRLADDGELVAHNSR